MDVPGESSQTRDAFKILERYCQKRYQRVQSLLSVSRTEEHLNPLTPRQPFSPLIASTSRFLFQPPDQLPPPLQHSVSSLTTTPGSPAAFSPALSPDEEQKAFEAPAHPESRSSHIWRVLKFVYQKLGLKHVLILLIMIAYSLLGGLLFYHLEAEFDQAEREQKKQLIDRQRVEAADSIVHLISNADCWFQDGPLFENSTERLLLDACNQQLNELLDVLVERVQRHTCGPKSAWEWDYLNAVFFALSIVTTIGKRPKSMGYGNLSCKTVEGRVATIFYALFGIPLFLLLLNLIGQVLFSACEATWKRTRQLLKRRARRIRRRLFSVSLRSHLKVGTADDKTETPNQMREMTEATVMAEEEEEEDRDIFQTFPLSLAFFIIFAYCLLCSLIVCLWEEWDWFSSFYFAFISMTTIGFGDIMPSHPHYSVGFFVFFIAGLALLSMCLELMKLRAENKYMQALQLIDDQHQALFATLPQPALPPTITIEDEPSPSHNLTTDASPRLPTGDFSTYADLMLRLNSRWRHPASMAAINEAVIADTTSRGASVSECLNPANYYASPVLSALLNRKRRSQRQNSRGLSQSSVDGGSAAQTPVGLSTADLRSPTDTSRLRPNHLWRDQPSFFAASTNSIASITPLTVIVENGNERAPPLAETDDDSDLDPRPRPTSLHPNMNSTAN